METSAEYFPLDCLSQLEYSGEEEGVNRLRSRRNGVTAQIGAY